MPKKSAARQKKADEAVRILNTTTGVNVPWAMILAGFPKKDIANETVRRMIRRCLEALKAKQTTPCRDTPTVKKVKIITKNDANLSPLTGEDDDPTASATTTTTRVSQHKQEAPHSKISEILRSGGHPCSQAAAGSSAGGGGIDPRHERSSYVVVDISVELQPTMYV